jgi:hypothetical protein
MPIKVLVVLDGDYRFAHQMNNGGIKDFTYTALTGALETAGMAVTKAHLGPDATADIQDFKFDGPGVNLLDFDVIWLIGNEGRNDSKLPPEDDPSKTGGLGMAQLNKLAEFMEQGGGVFATGDHDSIGADLSGHIPRVRAMRSWFGVSDTAKPGGLGDIPDNYPPMTSARADTTQPGIDSVYNEHPAPFVWFENQSDSTPQPILPTPPTHPILRHAGKDVEVFPDHMHEGRTLGFIMAHNYAQNSPFGDTTKAEFREIAGHLEVPKVIATGQALANANYLAGGGTTDTSPAMARTIDTISVYDGRVAGVGRIVTGSTFHHYVDINLTGDSDIIAGPLADKVGDDAMKGKGLSSNMDPDGPFAAITAVFVNMAIWLARPRPAIGLILERSTFSKDEVDADPTFEDAILLTVDGLKPTQFPGGGIPQLGAIAGSPAWVPTITVPPGVPIDIEPTFVDSDDPGMPDRVQRFTFTYRVHFTGNAFDFDDDFSTVPVEATLNAPVWPDALIDAGWLQLVKSANPFMLDLADGNEKTWLSSDVKVFHVIEGESLHGITLPDNASRGDALNFIKSLTGATSSAQFTNLPSAQAESTLSPAEMTTGNPAKRVYNFALARVRLSPDGADADDVRVFFRMFTTQTTAALTYNLDGDDLPVDGYLRTDDADPIALPGTHNGGNDWLSFPVFATTRDDPQHDDDNVKKVEADVGFKIFGALIDNNLPGAYLTQTPTSGGPKKTLPELLVGEHQCIVAQIEFAGAPIPSGVRPSTSDKLSQRNIAMSKVANPGLDASRIAMHTFEIEATPWPIQDGLPPDELLLDWSERTPEGTMLRLHIPSWNADEVVALADRFYPRHEIEAIDAHTIEMPGGGMRYVPIPISQHRQPGVIAVELPLGIQKGDRLDVSVRQITNRFRHARIPPPKVRKISLEEAERIVGALPTATGAAGAVAGAAGRSRGIELGGNKVLITDLSVFDAASDHALIIEHPDPETVKAAMRDAGRWREPIGAFQLGVPVSTKSEMLPYHMQLLSIMRWRAAHLPRRSRWRKAMLHYLDLLANKVRALGGDPFAVPATPDGAIPPLSGKDDDCGDEVGSGDVGRAIDLLVKKLLREPGCWLLLIIMLIILALLIWYVTR